MPNNTPVPLLDLKEQYRGLKDEIDAAIARVVESQYFIGGPEVEVLEAELAEYCGASHCVGVSSGSDALLVSLMALGIGPGDEVITTPFTFFATAGSIHRLGATPVFVDIDPLTFNIDPSQIAAKITSRTKAIMPVHLYGQCAEMDPILEVADSHGLAVIEDAAQAIGANTAAGGPGRWARSAAFRSSRQKNLGAFGDGGAVTTNDAALADRMRDAAQPRHGAEVFSPVCRRELPARRLAGRGAAGEAEAPLDTWTEARQRNAAFYDAAFASLGVPGESLATPQIKAESGKRKAEPTNDDSTSLRHSPLTTHHSPLTEVTRHIFNQYVLQVDRRDELVRHLKANGIGCEIYYPLALHQQACFRDLGYLRGDFPVSERAAERVLAIPIYPELSDEQKSRVVNEIAAFYGCCRQSVSDAA